MEVGPFADVEANRRHFVKSGRGKERVMLDVRVYRLALHDFGRLFPRKKLPILLPVSLVLLPILLLLHPAILLRLLRVIGRRDLQRGVNQQVEIGFLMPDPEIQILIDLIQCFGVDAFGEVGVLLGPVLKDGLEAGTDSYGLFE